MNKRRVLDVGSANLSQWNGLHTISSATMLFQAVLTMVENMTTYPASKGLFYEKR